VGRRCGLCELNRDGSLKVRKGTKTFSQNARREVRGSTVGVKKVVNRTRAREGDEAKKIGAGGRTVQNQVTSGC